MLLGLGATGPRKRIGADWRTGHRVCRATSTWPVAPKRPNIRPQTIAESKIRIFRQPQGHPHTKPRAWHRASFKSYRSPQSIRGTYWARYRRPSHEIPRSVLGWRTAAAARQRRSDVDPFRDAQRIFHLNAQITHCAIYVGTHRCVVVAQHFPKWTSRAAAWLCRI